MIVNIVKICLLALIIISCKHRKNEFISSKEYEFKDLSYEEQIRLISENTTEDSVLSFDQKFINEKLLNGIYEVDIKQYLKSDCYPIRRNKMNLIQAFEGFQNIGDIDNDGKDDFVFVLPSLNYCEEGESYYFSNPKIERIYTESNCCHPYSILDIGDIDEDGANEIAQYFSGCASRYKKINIWTLRDNKWKLIDNVQFTLNDFYEPFRDFHKLYKKKSKGIVQFLEISDVKTDGDLVSEWKTIKIAQ